MNLKSPIITTDKMKIYYAYLSDFSPEHLDKCFEKLPLKQKEKLNRVKSLKAKNESILVWHLLCNALSSMGITDFDIIYGENGKPFLAGIPLCFNLSHTDNLVCCAVGKSDIGIDAEKIKPVKESLLNKVLTENERKRLKETDSDFIRFWTLKESLLKYRGSGITPDIYKLDFSLLFEKDSFIYDSLLFTVKSLDEYFISVCSREEEREFILVKA